MFLKVSMQCKETICRSFDSKIEANIYQTKICQNRHFLCNVRIFRLSLSIRKMISVRSNAVDINKECVLYKYFLGENLVLIIFKKFSEVYIITKKDNLKH